VAQVLVSPVYTLTGRLKRIPKPFSVSCGCQQHADTLPATMLAFYPTPD